MREIKFRVWTGLTMEYRVVAGGLGVFYVEGLDPKDSACMSSSNTKYSDGTPVMQFTGLRDKNGREIYEGDIIEGMTRAIGCHKSEKVRYVIECIDDAMITCMNRLPRERYTANQTNTIHRIQATDGLSIIGNIHANPELWDIGGSHHGRRDNVDVAPAAIWPVITVAVFMAMLAIGMMVSEWIESAERRVNNGRRDN